MRASIEQDAGEIVGIKLTPANTSEIELIYAIHRGDVKLVPQLSGTHQTITLTITEVWHANRSDL